MEIHIRAKMIWEMFCLKQIILFRVDFSIQLLLHVLHWKNIENYSRKNRGMNFQPICGTG